MTDNPYTVILEEDEYGDVILPFPAELIEKYNWLEGDTLSWDIIDNGVRITNISAEARQNKIVDSAK